MLIACYHLSKEKRMSSTLMVMLQWCQILSTICEFVLLGLKVAWQADDRVDGLKVSKQRRRDLQQLLITILYKRDFTKIWTRFSWIKIETWGLVLYVCFEGNTYLEDPVHRSSVSAAQTGFCWSTRWRVFCCCCCCYFASSLQALKIDCGELVIDQPFSLQQHSHGFFKVLSNLILHRIK